MENHNKDYATIDFAHTLTTLASIENQDGHTREPVKSFFNLYLPELAKPKYAIAKVVSGIHDETTILQLNSFVGDILTYSSEKDIRSDMDAVILRQHPMYKNLPLHERLSAYYSQADLNEKRQCQSNMIMS